MSEYTQVSWSEEPVSIEKLQQMASNTEALFHLKPSAAIKHGGINRNKGMKMLAGSQLFQPSNTWSTTNTIYFGNYFSVGCSPLIIPVLYSAPQTGLNVAPTGLGGAKVPDHRGFNAYVWCDARNGNKGKIVQPYYVGYLALGF